MEIRGIDDNQGNGLWKGIWDLKVANKVKNLVWKACQNQLPTKSKLVSHMIIESTTCDHCQDVPKSVIHALCSCQELDVVWADEEL